MNYERIIGSIVYGRARAASYLGLSLDELKAIGQLAALEAELSWDPQGGRSLSSWVWLNVKWDIDKALRRAAQELAEDEDERIEDLDLDNIVLVREALTYLRAKLPSADWTALWLHHAEGWQCSEIARRYGMTSTAVHQQISRARKKAVRILAAHDKAVIGAVHVC